MAKNEELRKENIQRVRECFYQGGCWTKITLAETTGLSLAGTTNILQELLQENEILFNGEADSTGGRKSKEYVLNADFSHIGTIDCYRKGSQYSYRVQTFDLSKEILQEHIIYSKYGSLADFRNTLRWIMKDPLIHYLAISIPGVCQNGKIKTCDFPMLAHKDIGKIIQKECSIPYTIENDVNVACISYAHHDTDLKDIALVYQPEKEYIGCGILINGNLYNGFHHEAGEMMFLGTAKQNPKKELQKVITTLKAVLDPQKIIWCSDLVNDMEDTYDDLLHIQDIQSLIQRGLYEIGLRELLLQRKEEEAYAGGLSSAL